MKFAFTLIFCLVLFNISFAQTTIGLSIGGDYMSIEPGVLLMDTQERIDFGNVDGDINSFIWGGLIEQHLSKKAYFSLSALFSKKSFTDISGGYVQTIYDKIEFGHQTYSIDFNWSPFSNFYLGIGGTYSFFKNFNENGINSGSEFKSEYGALVSSSYRYKGLIFNLKYLHNLKVLEPREDTLVFLSPTKSIILSLSYVVEIIAPRKWQKSSRTDCPKF